MLICGNWREKWRSGVRALRASYSWRASDVMVAVSSAAGVKAPVPSAVVRTVEGLPWPKGLNVQPWRPRPTSTQPPPSVVMSQ